MVYDERSNFVGDTHWRLDSDLTEGEELELERGGILVEVGECIGTRDQDLSELVDKRAREKEERAIAKAAAGPVVTRASRTATPSILQHLKPKPLNAVLGTPTGHYGKAMVANVSPFEQKHSNHHEDNRSARPPKRQKLNDTPIKSGYAQNLLGATLNLGSSRPPSEQTIYYEPLRTRIAPRAPRVDPTLREDVDSTDVEAAIAPTGSGTDLTKGPRGKSSLPKNGYATNLTGATLALSGPRASTAHAQNLQRMMVTTSTASSFQDETHDTAAYRNYATSCSVTESKPSGRVERSSDKIMSGTLKLKQHLPNSIRNPSTSHKSRALQDGCSTKLMTEGPVTILKIKPRPPRQLMMLMEPPWRRKPNYSIDDEVVESSVTLETAEERRMLIKDTGTLTSSRQVTTDKHVPVPEFVSIPMSTDCMREGVEQIVSTLTVSGDGITFQKHEDEAILEGNRLPLQQKNSLGNVSEASFQLAVCSSSLSTMENPASRLKPASTPLSFEITEAPMIYEPELGLPEKERTTSAISNSDEPEKPLQPLETDPDPGTELRRQRLHASARQSGKHQHLPLPQGNGHSNPPRNRDPCPETLEGTMADITIKPSPTSVCPIMNFNQANCPTQSVNTMEHPLPSSELKGLRPIALRRSGISTTRNITNLERSVSNTGAVNAPMPPKKSGRAEAATMKGEHGVCPPVQKSASSGPWSREAFDLFGTWRPPGPASHSNF